MKYGYIIRISSRNLYKEIQLPMDAALLKVGTDAACDVRFYKEAFFETFALTFRQSDGAWSVSCSDNLYIDAGDVRKLVAKTLRHGDGFTVRYRVSENQVFKIDFLFDFDNEAKHYNRVMDISNKRSISIGSANTCNIVLNSPYAEKDLVEFKAEGDGYLLIIKHTTYGVYHNGQPAKNNRKICNGDFFSIANFSFFCKDGKLYTSTDTIVNGLTYVDAAEENDYPKFNRNTRLKTIIDEEKIEILDPPKNPQKPKSNMVLQLMPALVMIALTIVVRGFMGSGSNSAFILFSVCSMAVGVLTSVFSMISEKKEYKRALVQRESTYKTYIENKKKEIEQYRQEEAKKLEDIYISSETEIANMRCFSSDLFDKTPEDEDFLCVRIGTGEMEAKKKIAYKKQEQYEAADALAALPEKLFYEYQNLRHAPIVLHCRQDSVVGIIGSDQSLYAMVKNIVLDICTRHYYKDVKLAFLIRPEDREKFDWVRWLPHVRNEKAGIRNIVYSSESKNAFFEFLYVELSNRRQQKKTAHLPHYVVVSFEDWGIKTHPVSQFIAGASTCGTTFIFCENSKSRLPLGCSEILYLDSPGQGSIMNSDQKDLKRQFTYSAVDDAVLRQLAVKMAPVYCEEISLENALTKNITLYELFNIFSAEDLDLAERWSRSEIYKSMAAPIGVKTKDEVVFLDLHEKAHGPHGLVAGTTGSGKSEILQTYILSMCTLYHPYDVGFVIIDFKGGGMVNQFVDLPHLIGSITNIDGREINRSLMSIKAELQKRQKLFAENGVNNINNYIKLYKAGKIQTPIPHLVLIVDEFAELKAEQPEFMKELISAARIGRSLGVHLILATQKPSGQVNEQIWSNSKFKLCLKVQTKEDSNEVLKSPLASEIKEPGRAYLQVGNNEVFELFQSAYSGAPARNDESSVREYTLCEVALSGRKKAVYQQKKAGANGVAETQLDAIVKYVHDYCAAQKIKRLPNICLPPLADVIHYPKAAQSDKTAHIAVPVGIYDDPGSQLQQEAVLDLTAGNLAIVGSAQYGKTNLLQLILRGVADRYSPAEVHAYVLDFGSMALKVFDELNHIGGVVVASEDERLKNFFRMLSHEIKSRKETFSKMGITSFHSYKEAGYTDLAQILVVIDNFIALKELYPEYEENLLHLLREGTSLGVTVIITSLQTNGISYKYLSNFAGKICLYCNQNDEYGNLFDRCRMQPKNVPGRGLMQIGKTVYEYQTYLAFEGEREIDRVHEIQAFIAEKNRQYPLQRAKRIPEVPALLNMNYVRQNCTCAEKPYTVPVGVDYENVDFVTIDLTKTVTLGICGREKSGKTNFLSLILDYCQNTVFDYPVKAYLIDDYERQMEPFSGYGFVEKYTIDIHETELVFAELEEELQRRKEKVQALGLSLLDKEPLLLCIIENANLFESGGVSKQTVETYKRMIRTYKQFKILFIFSNIPNMNIAYGTPDMLKLMKELNLVFLFDDLVNVKTFDFSAAAVRKFKKPIALGDAYQLTADDTVSKIKTVIKE